MFCSSIYVKAILFFLCTRMNCEVKSRKRNFPLYWFLRNHVSHLKFSVLMYDICLTFFCFMQICGSGWIIFQKICYLMFIEYIPCHKHRIAYLDPIFKENKGSGSDMEKPGYDPKKIHGSGSDHILKTGSRSATLVLWQGMYSIDIK